MAPDLTASSFKPARSPFLAYIKEAKYELLVLARRPVYLLAVFGYPVLFFCLFGIPNATRSIDHHSAMWYLVVAYTCLASMGVGFWGIGNKIAYARSHGRLDLKRAFPMPPSAFLFAKFSSGLCFSVAGTGLLLVIATISAPLYATTSQIVWLFLANIACALVFSSFGTFLGLVLAGNSEGISNIVYLLCAFCGGMMIPMPDLPHFMQKIAIIFPSYYCMQLSQMAFGFSVPLHTLYLGGLMLFYFLFFGVLAVYMLNLKESHRG